MTTKNQDELFGTAPIRRILLKTAPPVMLAQLIQALYNIVDSFFVGKYSTDALTALTVIYPLQLIIIALAVGTGVGTNTYMAARKSRRCHWYGHGAGGGHVGSTCHCISLHHATLCQDFRLFSSSH